MGKLAILVLAAGKSRRLGQPKQLVVVDGQTLLERTARLAGEFSREVYCVLGYDAKNIAVVLEKLPVTCLTNKNWESGMGSSIALGVSQLGRDIDAVLILLCDQWALTHKDMDMLHQQWKANPQKIVASRYLDDENNEQVCGVPAVFPRKYFCQLTQLKKTGARKLLANYRSEVIDVEINNAGFDLDEPRDLQTLREMNQ